MDIIDTHLKSIVSTRLSSYVKSGNLEDMWEDLIFMNFMLHFKSLIRNNPEINGAEIGHFEYTVHIPREDTIGDLL